MQPNNLRKALLKNKYRIVKRTLRLTGQPINEAGYTDFDDDDSLDAIEAKLKASEKSVPIGNSDNWFSRLFKR